MVLHRAQAGAGRPEAHLDILGLGAIGCQGVWGRAVCACGRELQGKVGLGEGRRSPWPVREVQSHAWLGPPSLGKCTGLQLKGRAAHSREKGGLLGPG